MTSEGTKNVDFGLYLENGTICSAYQTPNIFIWIFLSDIFRHFKFQTPEFKDTRDRTKQIRIFFKVFDRFFSSAQPPVLGNADLRYHISRLNQNTHHILCRVHLRPVKSFLENTKLF